MDIRPRDRSIPGPFAPRDKVPRDKRPRWTLRAFFFLLGDLVQQVRQVSQIRLQHAREFR
jgi:hypothetical protein